MMMIGYLFQIHGLLRRVLFQIPDATMLDRRLPNKAGPRPHRTPNAKRRGKRPIRLARKRKQSRPEASPRVLSPACQLGVFHRRESILHVSDRLPFTMRSCHNIQRHNQSCLYTEYSERATFANGSPSKVRPFNRFRSYAYMSALMSALSSAGSSSRDAARSSWSSSAFSKSR